MVDKIALNVCIGHHWFINIIYLYRYFLREDNHITKIRWWFPNLRLFIIQMTDSIKPIRTLFEFWILFIFQTAVSYEFGDRRDARTPWLLSPSTPSPLPPSAPSPLPPTVPSPQPSSSSSARPPLPLSAQPHGLPPSPSSPRSSMPVTGLSASRVVGEGVRPGWRLRVIAAVAGQALVVAVIVVVAAVVQNSRRKTRLPEWQSTVKPSQQAPLAVFTVSENVPSSFDISTFRIFTTPSWSNNEWPIVKRS